MYPFYDFNYETQYHSNEFLDFFHKLDCFHLIVFFA